MTERRHDRTGTLTERGAVVEFDAGVGLGVIESEAGERVHFHCVEVADGSRDIPVGTPVGFARIAKLGRWEAASIRP